MVPAALRMVPAALRMVPAALRIHAQCGRNLDGTKGCVVSDCGAPWRPPPAVSHAHETADPHRDGADPRCEIHDRIRRLCSKVCRHRQASRQVRVVVPLGLRQELPEHRVWAV